MKKVLIILLAILFISCVSDNERINKEKKEVEEVCRNIDNDFRSLVPEIDETVEFLKELYSKENIDKNLKNADKMQYELTKEGVFYRKSYINNSAVFVSGYVPVDQKIKEIVYFTEPLDSFFKEKVNKNSVIAQIYYNDRNSYNRIYPGFDVLAQYQAKMNIPTFNFYYLADKKNNPLEKEVWIREPYVDPAGRGWMISLIKPLYIDGNLEGVPGIDVTINGIIGKYLVGVNEDIMILSSEGTIVAVSESIAPILALPQLKDHKYIETIKSDTYMPDNYNLLKSKQKSIRSLAEKIIKGESKILEYKIGEEKYSVVYAKIEELKWIGVKFIKH